MQEIFEESWAYREMVGKGIMQGHLEDARQTLIRLISKHYPELISFAEQQALIVNDLEILHDAVDALFDASTAEQARQILAQMTEKQGVAIRYA